MEVLWLGQSPFYGNAILVDERGLCNHQSETCYCFQVASD